MPTKKRDFYYNKAKQMGYRSRAAFKLKFINEKFGLIKKGDAVVDLGAAPGGWLQVAKEISEGTVIGVDLQRIEPVEGAVTIKGDMTSPETQAKIFEKVEKVNAVICDAAPNLSGNWALDHARSIDLSKTALDVAAKILAPGGNFLVKVFQGDLYQGFVDEVGRRFSRVYTYKSPASRQQSAEIYVIGKGFLTTGIRKGDVLDLAIDGVGKNGDGIAHVDGFVIFVKGAKQGSRVKVKITDVKPEFGFGKIEKGH
ncbi:ribosomal RNA large subunit methyltransferase J [Methanocella paludicola SANAE]|uniref:Ribosomal RNA large subunit methyltransferase E n=1 Tax=Methanocella paludicola (strain DSM 17711 / JCM 13418 / NBRC 101707 / SANAE) TaxID=304371 RepID=D1YZT5_METPS|nr:23S rRNA (uridine(2552)-2'-O)-methyltransferase [Methanocella paludicola]BAI61957.1 ribosomal RNA large subunit methyltransferase J [Methanocella paludicola SANAE]